MKKLILIALAVFSFIGCSITKDLKKKELSTNKTTVKEQVITRPGDTITIDIPNIRYKDTVIERVNYKNKTIARVTYDNGGNQRFECLSAEFKEELRLIRNEIKNDISTRNKTDNNFNPQYFVYSIIGLGIILIIGFLVISYTLSRYQKQIPELLKAIYKDVSK